MRSVLENWKRAREIVATNAEFYRIRDDVEGLERRWEKSNKKRDLLIPKGVPLAEAESIAKRYPGELSPPTLGFIAATVYSLWFVQRVFAGKYTGDGKAADLDAREFAVLGAQALGLLWLGLYPQPVLDAVRPALVNTEIRVSESYPRDIPLLRASAAAVHPGDDDLPAIFPAPGIRP